MHEDIRHHSPNPTTDEIAWMTVRPARTFVRVLALACVAALVALAAAEIDAHEPGWSSAGGADAEEHSS